MTSQSDHPATSFRTPLPAVRDIEPTAECCQPLAQLTCCEPAERPGCCPDPERNEVWMPVTAGPTTSGRRSHDSPQAWTEVHQRLRAFVGRRVSDPYAADDVAQEVLLRLHRSLVRLRREDRLDAFAYEIARNAITDYYRAKARERAVPSLPSDLAAAAEADPNDEQPSEDPDGREQLARCLEPIARRLPPPYRDALMLTDLGDLSQVQAARLTGLSVPGMKTRVQRARAQLRELLTECCEVALDARHHIAEVQQTGPCACAPKRPARRPSSLTRPRSVAYYSAGFTRSPRDRGNVTARPARSRLRRGIIETRHHGTFAYYFVHPQALADLAVWLGQTAEEGMHRAGAAPPPEEPAEPVMALELVAGKPGGRSI